MKKNTLRGIKELMKDAHNNAPYALAAGRKVEKEYDKKIAAASWYFERESLTQRKGKAIADAMRPWSAEGSYYLIYNDGSCACTSDDDLISGDKLPRLTGIVYAEYQGTDDHYDTETGDLHFYEGDDVDYEAEDTRKQAYDDAIEIKYGTDYGRKISTRKQA